MAFKPGQSGNPSGRPKGIKDRRTIFRDMIEPRSEELLNTAVDLALSGNEAMLRLLLERILPAKPKDNMLEINLPNGNLIKQVEEILNLLRNGDISSNDASKLMNLSVAQIKIIEVEEFDRRLKIVEENLREQSEL